MLRRSLEPSELGRFRNCPSKRLRFVVDLLEFSSFRLCDCSSLIPLLSSPDFYSYSAASSSPTTSSRQLANPSHVISPTTTSKQFHTIPCRTG
jgi:hypothetical protein